uniref:Rapamycin-insensitive companion of mTOR domain-containing protein n=1 Tax=Heliothis virescens TaxID=7102 RepID=A0A2A4J023_HELVI
MSLSNGYLEDSVLVHIVRLAKYNPVYSVRATAFYVLGLIGSTYDGANLLSDLGWLCVRHTRHDQFPVIPDESYSTIEQGTNVHYFVTSPESRYNAYDTEMSEHSDHTDQSVAESLHSDTTKLYGKTGSISADTSEIKDQDVTDHKAYSDGRPDKRKSHTLPSQSCSSSHERPTLSESRTVDILRDCSSYERPGPHRVPMSENRLVIGRMNSLEHAHEGRVRNTSESSTSGVSSCDSFLGKYALPMNSLEHAHEGRVRNTSESSTSGVSSCDSFLGKYALPDRVLTLSPIPSSSSLYGMKSSNSSHRPKISDLQRRTSTSSFTGNDVASSPPSQMDMTGYATLKSLNRRPYLSESAAGSSDMDDLSWLLSDTNRRSKPFSSLRDRAKTTKERMAKLSLLEYDWKPLPLGENARSSPLSGNTGTPGNTAAAGVTSAQARRATCPAAPPPQRPHGTSPAYIGICLPRDLMELFPRDEDILDEDTDKSDHTKRDRLPSFLVDTSSASTENKSRATPDSQKLTSHKASLNTIAVQIHKSNSDKAETNVSNADTSIASLDTSESNTRVTKEKPKRIVTTVNENDTNTNSVPNKVDEVKSTDNESKDDVISTGLEIQGQIVQEVVGLRSTDGGDMVQSIGAVVNDAASASSKKWRHVTADCLACVRTRPPSSHELREAFFAGMDVSSSSVTEPRSPTNDKSAADRNSGPQAELLHQVHFMSNPIHLRQARSVLLSMKQRHPEVFRSPCVYSDVSALLARDTYMLCARRFVQELFLDTNFECFAGEPAAVLSRHGVVSPTTSVAPAIRQ